MASNDQDSPKNRVKGWLDRFQRTAETGPWGVPNSHHFPAAGNGPHILIGVITHGNEFGTLPAALRLQSELLQGTVAPDFPVTLLLGNPAAARENVRFVEEDFNRVMTFDRPADNAERRRADEVRPLLDVADFFLDIHQTQTPTESAFWTMPWEMNLGVWARALGAAPVGLTRAGGGSFSKGKCCLDEYVRARGRVGITVEVGEKGEDEAQVERAYRCMRRVLEIHERLAKGELLETMAAENPEVAWFETKDVVPAESTEHRLRPGIGNFTRVKAGELLSPAGAPEIRASSDGAILFPKYQRPGDAPPPELFRIGVEIDDPETRYG